MFVFTLAVPAACCKSNNYVSKERRAFHEDSLSVTPLCVSPSSSAEFTSALLSNVLIKAHYYYCSQVFKVTNTRGKLTASVLHTYTYTHTHTHTHTHSEHT